MAKLKFGLIHVYGDDGVVWCDDVLRRIETILRCRLNSLPILCGFSLTF